MVVVASAATFLLFVPLDSVALRGIGRCCRSGWFAGVGATVGRTALHVNRVEVCSAKLPSTFDGMRIVQLSDMHVGTIVSPERELRRIVDSVEALQPDLIVLRVISSMYVRRN